MAEFYNFVGMTTIAILTGLLSRFLYDKLTAKKDNKKSGK